MEHPAKMLNQKWFRGFESLPLRHYKIRAPMGAFFVGGEEQVNCFTCVRDSKRFSHIF